MVKKLVWKTIYWKGLTATMIIIAMNISMITNYIQITGFTAKPLLIADLATTSLSAIFISQILYKHAKNKMPETEQILDLPKTSVNND